MSAKFRLLPSRFQKSVAGNVTLIFAAALIPIMGMVGAAIDYNRMSSERGRMQDALDAAVLAAATLQGSKGEKKTAFFSAFKANYLGPLKPAAITKTIEIDADGNIIGDATGDVPMVLMGLFGKNIGEVAVHSETANQLVNIEMVFVLDVSGSMKGFMSGAGSRIESLKASAKNLAKTIESRRAPGQKISFAIVPFNMNVNIGTENASYVSETDNALFDGSSWAGCVLERKPPHHVSDRFRPDSRRADGKWHAYIWPPEPNNIPQCLNPSNGTNSGYASIDNRDDYTVMTVGPNYNCVRHPIVPLTQDLHEFTSKIDSLTAEGNQGTIIAPGVSWGLRVLSPSEPFRTGAKFSGKTRKVMIVLTDGEQTTEAEYHFRTCDQATNTSASYEFDPATFGLSGRKLSGTGPRDTFSAYGYILDSDPLESGNSTFADVANDLYKISIDACTEAKKPRRGTEIEIFTIAVSEQAAPGSRVWDLLSKCASLEENTFHVLNANQMNAAFQKIGDQVQKIRLSQ